MKSENLSSPHITVYTNIKSLILGTLLLQSTYYFVREQHLHLLSLLGVRKRTMGE